MRIFPVEDFIIELNFDKTTAISILEKNTLNKDQYIGNWNSQKFIGEVKEDQFEVKLSKKIYGEFCLFQGNLKERKVSLHIKVSKIVKILFSIIILFIVSGIITALFEKKWEAIFLLITSIILFWFLLQVGFKIISKRGIKKLKETIGINNTTAADI